jgi:prepilin-type processing-associated H-X9-DG protein
MVFIPLAAPQSDVTNLAPVKFQGTGFFCPKGYSDKPGFYDVGGTGNCTTYFSFDYGPSGKNGCQVPPGQANYPNNPTLAPCQAGTRSALDLAWLYGPSSGHPSSVNCLFGDGSVRSVRKDVDAAALFFAVTRNNGDPAATDAM